MAQIDSSVEDAAKVIAYAQDRVFKGVKVPSAGKVLSISDPDAAFIKKGSRNPVIGYKPQIVRSANGFVVALEVPRGNTADCAELKPAIENAIKRTGVTPDMVSTDDGYASAEGRQALLDMGIADVSISGSKGRKLTGEGEWASGKYQHSRAQRSAVESLMFTLKDGFDFGELGRRGLEPVREELLEKVLAYNLCRIILIRKRRLKQRKLAA
jgi:IS5 family transposase